MNKIPALFLPLILIFLSHSVLAQEILESEQFRLELPPLSTQPFSQRESTPEDGSAKKPADKTGQTFSQKGVLITIGPLHTTDTTPFSISLSPAVINYEQLLPETPILKHAKVKVKPGSNPGYQLSIWQSTPLTNSRAATIKNTICSKQRQCKIENARPWKKNDSYGFGYHLAGDDISPDFKNQDYFRPLATKSYGDKPAVIMSAFNVSGSREAEINFKVLINSKQAAGVYSNTINFIALPRY